MRASEILVHGLTILTAFLVGSALSLACCEARLQQFKTEAVEKNAAYYDKETGEFTWMKIQRLDQLPISPIFPPGLGPNK